jgi:hypothetical protein
MPSSPRDLTPLGTPRGRADDDAGGRGSAGAGAVETDSPALTPRRHGSNRRAAAPPSDDAGQYQTNLAPPERLASLGRVLSRLSESADLVAGREYVRVDEECRCGLSRSVGVLQRRVAELEEANRVLLQQKNDLTRKLLNVSVQVRVTAPRGARVVLIAVAAANVDHRTRSRCEGLARQGAASPLGARSSCVFG